MASSITSYFAEVPDPRGLHGRQHLLNDLFAIAICAVVCGAQDWSSVATFGRIKEAWFRQFLRLPSGIPSHDTFTRVFAQVDPEIFERCFQKWTTSLAGMLVGVVSLDGKTLRRSFDKAGGKAAIHMVSAWAADNQLVFGQVATDAKSNEITAIPKLLEMMDIKGLVVTIDAMGCQKDIAEMIVDKGGDYVLAVKENQPTLHQDVKGVFESTRKDGWKDRGHDVHTEHDKGHGRLERRTTTITWDAAWLFNTAGWKGLGCLVEIERERTVADGPATITRHYFIASVQTRQAKSMAQICRSHWGVENQLHWQLDMAFTEDQRRLRVGHSAENMSRLCRIALNLLKNERTCKLGIANKRLQAGWSSEYLLKVLGADLA